MTEGLRLGPWGYRIGFVVLAALLMFLRLLPLANTAGAFPGPDLLLCVMLVWMMRRPDFLPVWLIAAVVLIEDLLLWRPPGLQTALVVLATEFLRSRTALTRELSLMVEVLLASGLMVVMFLMSRLIMMLVLMEPPPFGFAISQVLWSIATYPVVVAISRLALDLRRPSAAEVEQIQRGG